MLVIKNGKNTQTLRFGYSCLKTLGEKFGLPGIQAVVMKVINTFTIFFDAEGNISENIEDIPFEVIDVLTSILQAASGEEDFKGVSYGDFIFENMDQVGKVMEAFLQSLPQEKKPIALK